MNAIGNFDLSKETLNFIVNRTINVCVRATDYIFCMQKSRTFKLVKTDTDVSSNMSYYGEYYCKSR